jgi:hypothetical protein
MTLTSQVPSAKAVGPNAGLVTAYLIVPQGPGLFPTVIFGHWCMPGSEKKNRTEFLDETLAQIEQWPDPGLVREGPGFAEDSSSAR